MSIGKLQSSALFFQNNPARLVQYTTFDRVNFTGNFLQVRDVAEQCTLHGYDRGRLVSK